MFKKDKIYYVTIIWLLQLMLGVSLAFSNDTVSLEFGEIDTENQVVPVLYDSPGDIAAFKFYVLGMDVTNVFGGVAGDNNYFLNQREIF